MNDNYINVLVTFDEGYIIPGAVTMTSVAENIKHDRKVRFFVFSNGLSNKSIDKLNSIKNSEVININVTPHLHKFKNIDISKFKNTYISLAGNYRLLMFDLLPDYVDKCIYLDSDIIVNTDLSIIYDQLSDDKMISVIAEICAMHQKETILKHCFIMPEFENFATNPLKYPYFNSGFYVVDVKKAREVKISDDIFSFLEKYPDLPYSDQDTLNAVFGQKYPEKIIHLDPSYDIFCDYNYNSKFENNFYSQNQILKAFKAPKVYHYGGPNKPWVNNICWYYYEWWKYFFASPFSDNEQYNKKWEEIFFDTKKNICSFKPDEYQHKIDKYFLFGIIPLFTVKFVDNTKKYYLFNSIPLMRKKVFKI